MHAACSLFVRPSPWVCRAHMHTHTHVDSRAGLGPYNAGVLTQTRIRFQQVTGRVAGRPISRLLLPALNLGCRSAVSRHRPLHPYGPRRQPCPDPQHLGRSVCSQSLPPPGCPWRASLGRPCCLVASLVVRNPPAGPQLRLECGCSGRRWPAPYGARHGNSSTTPSHPLSGRPVCTWAGRHRLPQATRTAILGRRHGAQHQRSPAQRAPTRNLSGLRMGSGASWRRGRADASTLPRPLACRRYGSPAAGDGPGARPGPPRSARRGPA